MLEVHRGAQVAEAPVGGGHREKRRGQLDLAVVDNEVGVGGHRVAHHRVLPQVGHRVAAVAQVVAW